ncbi:MAG: hypothetical protein JXM73_07075 [Anaerolineae bacterium]|nr:hypothetical protein [Anaerolineae bacterium]
MRVATDWRTTSPGASASLHTGQRITKVQADSEIIGAEVKRILASPFYQKVVHIQQQVGRSGGRVVGLKVEELVVAPQLVDLSALRSMALRQPSPGSTPA